MIPVVAAEEQEDFDERVRRPGLDAIAELVGEEPSRRRRGRRRQQVAETREEIPSNKFPAFWRNVLPDMLVAYERRCAYLALYIEHATGNPSVDHVVPQSRAWDQVYEWSNYRLAAATVNTKKSNREGLLDPFEIEEGWFALELVTYQVVPGPNATGALVQRVQDTIDDLGLSSEACCKAREAYVKNYLVDAEPIPLAYVERRAPFIAQELRRQGLLRDGDQ